MREIIEKYPHIQSFCDEVSRISEIQSNHIDGYLVSMNDNHRQSLERRLNYLKNIKGYSLSEIAKCYLSWCTYFVKERKFFITHNEQYRNRSFDDIAPLYQNGTFMKNYMIGLSISAYLWQIQRANLTFFEKYCVRDNHESGRYLEVGPGHGEYMTLAMEKTRFDTFLGIDISQSAVDQTKEYLQFYFSDNADYLNKVSVKCEDFFSFTEKDKFDAIVISQVIEHVENPGLFLLKTAELAKDDALIYISTAINSPFPDHIFHFHSREEVVELIQESNLEIIDEFQSTSDGISIDKAKRNKYDIVIGFILRPIVK